VSRDIKSAPDNNTINVHTSIISNSKYTPTVNCVQACDEYKLCRTSNKTDTQVRASERAALSQGETEPACIPSSGLLLLADAVDRRRAKSARRARSDTHRGMWYGTASYTHITQSKRNQMIIRFTVVPRGRA